MYCPKCGAPVGGASRDEKPRFCTRCGAMVWMPEEEEKTAAPNTKPQGGRRKWIWIVVAAAVLIAAALWAVLLLDGESAGGRKSVEGTDDILRRSLQEVAVGENGSAMMQILVDHCHFGIVSEEETADGLCVTVTVKSQDALSALRETAADETVTTQEQMLACFEENLDAAQALEQSCTIWIVQTTDGREAQFDAQSLNACLGGFLSYVDELAADYEEAEDDE